MNKKGSVTVWGFYLLRLEHGQRPEEVTELLRSWLEEDFPLGRSGYHSIVYVIHKAVPDKGVEVVPSYLKRLYLLAEALMCA